MANSSLILSSLDFDTLKANFKEYLKAQNAFKDYNFDGSNISVLLDVMSYNSYLNSFYLNMIASEMFMDSAQTYDAVVSHAKELNYLPQSTRSSVAEISITLETTGMNGRMTIPSGTRFSGVNSNGSFTFITNQTKDIISSNNIFTASNILVYDGDKFQDSILVDYNIENQKFILSNKNVDISSITVTVIENGGQTVTVFKEAENLYGLNSLSSVYFLQPAQNNLYEIVFGDGLFGRKPLNASVVLINYRIANGPAADNVTSIILEDDLGPINGGTIVNQNVTVISSSSGGGLPETLESIRFSAPRYFSTQQRAVTTDDYAALVLDDFTGTISDVTVYGGQDVEPKLYGRVIISVKPTKGAIASDYVKSQIIKYLDEYISLPTRVVITDPDYLYISIKSIVQYDPTTTTKTISELDSVIRSTISSYSTNNLEKFGNDLRYSRLVASIDGSDNSITSNDTNLRIIKRLVPKLNYNTTYSIELEQPLYYEGQLYNTAAEHTALHNSNVEHATLYSSEFTYNAKDGNVYPFTFFEDDGAGNINAYTVLAGQVVMIETVGSIDYTTGSIKLSNINIANYSEYISLYVRGYNKDIFATKNKIILVEQSDISLTVEEKIV